MMCTWLNLEDQHECKWSYRLARKWVINITNKPHSEKRRWTNLKQMFIVLLMNYQSYLFMNSKFYLLTEFITTQEYPKFWRSHTQSQVSSQMKHTINCQHQSQWSRTSSWLIAITLYSTVNFVPNPLPLFHAWLSCLCFTGSSKY